MIGSASQRTFVIEREREVLMRFAEEFGIHFLLDISVIVFIDIFLRNTIKSVLVGDYILDVAQFF